MQPENFSRFSQRVNRFLCFFTPWLILASYTERPASAHVTSISTSDIQIQREQIEVRLKLNLYELNFIAQLDGNSDLVISHEELIAGVSQLVPRLLDNFQIRSQGETGKATLGHLDFEPNRRELQCSLAYSFSQPLDDLYFKVTLHNITDPGHWNLAQLRYDGQQEQRFFNLENPEAKIELRRGWRSYLRLGMRFLVFGGKSIFTGYDTLAFLVGLLVVEPSSHRLLKTVGAFLMAQTATFLLAAFNLISLPPRFIDSAIALSVAYIALENLLLKKMTNRWLIACFFGLIYGFSFFAIIKESGLPKKGVITSVLSFNLGTMLGVSVITGLIFSALLYLNSFHWQKRATTFTSLVLVVFGFFWFVQRSF